MHDPFTREPYSRDPRNVARKAENYLASTGIADTAYFGAEAEFYIFDSVAFDSKMNGTFYEVDSESGWWNTGEPFEADGSPNRGYKVRPKGGYFPSRPTTTTSTCATRWPPTSSTPGSPSNAATTRSVPPVRPRSTTSSTPCCTPPTTCCCSSTSSRTPPGRPARPSPSCLPLFGDNGSGMHVHQSLWKDGKPLFHDESVMPAVRHRTALHRRHPASRPSLLAFTNPR